MRRLTVVVQAYWQATSKILTRLPKPLGFLALASLSFITVYLVFAARISAPVALTLKDYGVFSLYYMPEPVPANDGVKEIPFLTASLDGMITQGHIEFELLVKPHLGVKAQPTTALEIITLREEVEALDIEDIRQPERRMKSGLARKLRTIYKGRIPSGHIKIFPHKDPLVSHSEVSLGVNLTKSPEYPNVVLEVSPQIELWFSRDRRLLGLDERASFSRQRAAETSIIVKSADKGIHMRVLSNSPVAITPLRGILVPDSVPPDRCDQIRGGFDVYLPGSSKPITVNRLKSSEKIEWVACPPPVPFLTLLLGAESQQIEVLLVSTINDIELRSPEFRLDSYRTSTLPPFRGRPTLIGEFHARAARGNLQIGVESYSLDGDDDVLIMGKNLQIVDGSDEQIVIKGVSHYIALNGTVLSRSLWTLISPDIRQAIVGALVSIVVGWITWLFYRKRSKKEQTTGQRSD